MRAESFAALLGVGGGMILKRSEVAGPSRTMPVGSPLASRSILPPAGSGVSRVMCAAASAAVLATRMCPSVRSRTAGWPAETASMS